MPDFIRNYNVELLAKNLRVDLGIAPDIIKTWDSGLWRAPRLLVPIQVEALVVESAENGPWADMRLIPEGIPGYLEAKAGETPEVLPQRPKPFDDLDEPRQPGIYLHWALPDGLTKGAVSKQTEEAPPSLEDVGNPPQPEAVADEDIDFPVIPDRWLIIRTSPGFSPKSKRRVDAWVIESEEEPENAVTAWNIWQEDRSDDKPDRWLTALGYGDPAYMAFYDNVENMLGFYDSMQGVQSGPVTYTVMGWYSRREDDPLFAPQSRNEYTAVLQQLGWSVGDDNTRLEKAAKDAKAKADKLKLNLDVTAKANYAISTVADESLLLGGLGFQVLSQPAVTDVNLVMGSFMASLNAAAISTPAPLPEKAFSPSVALESSMIKLAENAIIAVQTGDPLFEKYWARQMLCHGTVFDVGWHQGGGSLNPASAGVPKAGTVKVAVGNTGLEALAAALATESNKVDSQRLLTGYHYGVLSVLSEPDGIASLESLLHSEDFQSLPGGYVVDMIEEGALFRKDLPEDKFLKNQKNLYAKEFSEVSAAAQNFAVYQAKQQNLVYSVESPVNQQQAYLKGIGQFGVNVNYVAAPLIVKEATSAKLAQGLFYEADNQKKLATPEKPTRKQVPFRRALPRYWEPKDLAVLLIEAHRSFKHGEDGRFSENDTLACRVSGETEMTVKLPVTGLADPDVRPTDLTAITIETGQLPPEVKALFYEALLLDTSNAPVAVQAVYARNGVSSGSTPTVMLRKSGSGLSPESAYAFEVTQHWNMYTNPLYDGQTIGGASTAGWELPSLISMQPWRKPWTPLHLEWQVGWYPSPKLQRDWRLGEHEFEYDSDDLGTDGEPAQEYTGRTLLTPGVTRVLATQLAKFLDDEEKAVTDLATPTQEKNLGAVLVALNNIDALATTLSGLHDAMVGVEDVHHFEGVEITGDDETPEDGAAPTEIFPVRAGHLRLQRLRVVDAFGQVYEVDANMLNAPVHAGDVEPTGADDTSLIRLPPRILQPTRAMLRFLNADNDAIEGSKTISPVCGWIMPDHLDEALEVYDRDGISQGQVQLAPDEKNIEWQGVPGNPGALGAPPALANSHLSRFVQGLLTWGTRDKHATDDPDLDTPKESALSALLRMIDATLWTVDPVGREGDEHLSVLVGRPLALVRAELRLELDGEPLTDELRRTDFPFRLGAVNRLQDGLMGYFVNDDYTQFYPVHESIAAQTRPGGPHKGFLGPIETVPNYYLEFSQSGEDGETKNLVDPVNHPYINIDPVVRLRPNQKIRLTLLIDPRGGVHLTGGLVPRKRIELMREHVAKALDNIIVTFRVGPVLSDPETIRMPLPAEIRGGWSWIRRTGPTVWEEDQVVNATDEALLSDKATEITEGWLKLSGAYLEHDEEASP